MREIKFRAWDTEKKIMSPELIEVGESIVSENGEVNGALIPLQYTTLKDKNGVEIYEGDIVQYQVDDSDLWGKRHHFGVRTEVVTWSPFFVVEESSGGPDNTYRKIDIEVIGNIFENPEMDFICKK